MREKITKFFKKHPFSGLLGALLVPILLTTLKPTYYLAGWDNFSSYFNLPTTIFRTLFHTWRSYRGLGVASDSEIVDLPRQLFFALFSLVSPTQILDQIYVLTIFILGVVCMYLFSKQLYEYFFASLTDAAGSVRSSKLLSCLALPVTHMQSYASAFAFFATFFYIFNLSTLSSFYFYSLPYVVRFLALPLSHLFLLWTIKQKVRSRRMLYLFLVLLLFASTSYITATLFITMLLSLAIHAVVYLKSFRKVLTFGALFLGINAFWLVPFLNYAWTKSAIIPFATANIEGDQVLLNQAPSLFSLGKQLIFFPQFLSISYTNPVTGAPEFFHSLGQSYGSFPTYQVLFFFPLLFLIGCIILSIFATKYLFPVKKVFPTLALAWIPLHTAIFFFLSLKEYSVFGFFYRFLSTYIPFFDVIFRFGDAKFHPFAAFSGSLAAAFAMLYLGSALVQVLHHWQQRFDFTRLNQALLRYLLSAPKRVLVLFAGLIIIPTLLVFRSYFTGSFVAHIFYTQIPDPYFSIAQTINADPTWSRVLHMPMDKNAYWKPYTWGYFGSSFFHNLIDKPYLDRTFEPASRENTYLINEINALSDTLIRIQHTDEKNETERGYAEKLHRLLQDGGFKYLVLDETIHPYSAARQERYWGAPSVAIAKHTFEILEKYDYIRLVERHAINPYDYQAPTRGEKPEENPILDAEIVLPQHLSLYTLNNPKPLVSFEGKAQLVDPNLTDILPTTLYPASENRVSLQQAQKTYTSLLYPFQRTDHAVTTNSAGTSLGLPTTLLPGAYTITSDTVASESGHLLRVTAKQSTPQSVTVTLFKQDYPTLGTTRFESELDTITFNLSATTVTNFAETKLRVGTAIFSLSNFSSSGQEVTVGHVFVEESTVPVRLLAKDETLSLPTDLFITAETPDCQGTKLTGYYPFVEGKNEEIMMNTRNGSLCLIGDLSQVVSKPLPYAELQLNLTSTSVDLDKTYQNKKRTPTALEKLVMSEEKPSTLYACVEQPGSDGCYNPYRFYSLRPAKTLTIPVTKEIEHPESLRVILTLRNIGYQEQHTTISSRKLITYAAVLEDSVEIPQYERPLTYRFSLSQPEKLTIQIPHLSDTHATYNSVQAYDITTTDTPCENPDGYRTIRQVNDTFMNFTNTCGSGLFYALRNPKDHLYLWYINYSLLSGQHPSLTITDKYNEYAHTRISLDQGYPSFPEFKKVRATDPFLSSRSLNNLSYRTGSLIFTPTGDEDTQKEKVFGLSQYSGNDGVMSVSSFNLVSLPASWRSLHVIPEKLSDTTEYPTISQFSVTSPIPSIKKVTLAEDLKPGTYLITLREGFDSSWVMTDTLAPWESNTLQTIQGKCNGLYNCYELTLKTTLNKGESIYLLYNPEILNLLGIVLTLATSLGILLLRSKKAA